MNVKSFASLLAWIVLFSFSACGSDDESATLEAPGSVLTPGAPVWAQKAPVVVYGAVSADLRMQADRDASVYWIVATKAMALTSEQLKTEVLAPSGNGNVKSFGTTVLTGTGEKVEKITGLKENTDYFVYSVGESKADKVLEAKVNVKELKTHFRQSQANYNSTAENRKVEYLLYKPEDAWKYPDAKYPICFFLGGNGEVAALGKINLLRNGSLPEYISLGNDVPMIVMSLQQIKTDWNSNLVDEGVEYAFANFPVDLKKVYMTGMSGGGFGTWNYAVGHASKLTAIVPISGGGNKGKACELKNVPVYAFHNKVDGLVGLSNSVTMVDAVNACPPKEQAKLVIFPDEGHNCWRRVYSQNHWDWSLSPGTTKVDIYAWMLSKSK